MSYRQKILQAHALLKEAQRGAEAAGDYRTADEVGYAIACCRSAEIMAEGFNQSPVAEAPRVRNL